MFPLIYPTFCAHLWTHCSLHLEDECVQNGIPSIMVVGSLGAHSLKSVDPDHTD